MLVLDRVGLLAGALPLGGSNWGSSCCSIIEVRERCLWQLAKANGGDLDLDLHEETFSQTVRLIGL
eukprot:57827-Pelagomonas_calceolata.AAC.1